MWFRSYWTAFPLSAAMVAATTAMAQDPLDALRFECGTREQVAVAQTLNCAFGIIEDGMINLVYSTDAEDAGGRYYLSGAGPGERPQIWVIDDLNGQMILLEYETAENGNLTNASTIAILEQR